MAWPGRWIQARIRIVPPLDAECRGEQCPCHRREICGVRRAWTLPALEAHAAELFRCACEAGDEAAAAAVWQTGLVQPAVAAEAAGRWWRQGEPACAVAALRIAGAAAQLLAADPGLVAAARGAPGAGSPPGPSPSLPRRMLAPPRRATRSDESRGAAFYVVAVRGSAAACEGRHELLSQAKSACERLVETPGCERAFVLRAIHWAPNAGPAELARLESRAVWACAAR